MTDHNNYLAYAENDLVGASPMRLVVALYQGAIESVRLAAKCFETGDAIGRGRQVSKTTNIITELMCSLDMEKGGEVSINLKKLYSYMQQRVLTAHTQRTKEPLVEVEGLLVQLLEAWNVVAADGAAPQFAPEMKTSLEVEDYGELIVEREPEEMMVYPGYFLENGGSVLGQAYSF